MTEKINMSGKGQSVRKDGIGMITRRSVIVSKDCSCPPCCHLYDCDGMCDCGHPRDDHTRTGFCLVVYCECIGPTSQGGET